MENNEKLLIAIKEACVDNRINCAAARKIAEEYQVNYAVVGGICNEAKIKIMACELGCF